MIDKIKVSKTNSLRVLRAAELGNVKITGTEEVGEDVFMGVNFRSAQNIFDMGGYATTLGKDAKPTPPKVAAPVATKGK